MKATVLVCVAVLATAGWTSVQVDPAARVAAAQKLVQSGDLPAAIRLLQDVVATAPDSYDARLALGRALDLDGRHDAARIHLEEAVDLATDENRNAALTALGISYAFESRADEAARYYQRAFDALIEEDPRGAASLANALGRIYLESGHPDKAQQWYTTGYETARKIPGRTAEEDALWEMRRHNAFGRIAARRGDIAGARAHAAAVEALLARGGNEGQRVFLPYLLGYVAFHARDYRRAIEDLQRGDQQDPFVLGLIARAYERIGERDRAREYYRKVMAIPAHGINAAFARPRARAALR